MNKWHNSIITFILLLILFASVITPTSGRKENSSTKKMYKGKTNDNELRQY
jgi:hypothetical protein